MGLVSRIVTRYRWSVDVGSDKRVYSIASCERVGAIVVAAAVVLLELLR